MKSNKFGKRCCNIKLISIFQWRNETVKKFQMLLENSIFISNHETSYEQDLNFIEHQIIQQKLEKFTMGIEILCDPSRQTNL